MLYVISYSLYIDHSNIDVVQGKINMQYDFESWRSMLKGMKVHLGVNKHRFEQQALWSTALRGVQNKWMNK
jgi:hypothetical protein